MSHAWPRQETSERVTLPENAPIFSEHLLAFVLEALVFVAFVCIFNQIVARWIGSYILIYNIIFGLFSDSKLWFYHHHKQYIFYKQWLSNTSYWAVDVLCNH